MTIFIFSLAGIPPLGGWYAKLSIFTAALDAGTTGAVVLALVAGVNSVIALFYYASVARQMWMQPVPDGDTTPIRVPPALGASLIVSAVAVLVVGVYPNVIARLGDAASLIPK